jgi:hypothetical protein
MGLRELTQGLWLAYRDISCWGLGVHLSQRIACHEVCLGAVRCNSTTFCRAGSIHVPQSVYQHSICRAVLSWAGGGGLAASSHVSDRCPSRARFAAHCFSVRADEARRGATMATQAGLLGAWWNAWGVRMLLGCWAVGRQVETWCLWTSWGMHDPLSFADAMEQRRSSSRLP